MIAGIEIPVLGLLAERDMHGYDLDREMELSGLRRWMPVSKVAVYKALARLEKSGCLDSRADRAGNMPERVVYSLTEQGRQRLRDLIYDLLASDEPLNSRTSLALYFETHLPAQDALGALESRLRFLECELRARQAEFSMLEDVATELQKLLRGHDINRHRLEIQWLREVAECVRQGKEAR